MKAILRREVHLRVLVGSDADCTGTDTAPRVGYTGIYPQYPHIRTGCCLVIYCVDYIHKEACIYFAGKLPRHGNEVTFES